MDREYVDMAIDWITEKRSKGLFETLISTILMGKKRRDSIFHGTKSKVGSDFGLEK